MWGVDGAEVNDAGAALLDSVAAAGSLGDWQRTYAMDAIRMPETELSFRPYDPDSHLEVTVR